MKGKTLLLGFLLALLSFLSVIAADSQADNNAADFEDNTSPVPSTPPPSSFSCPIRLDRSNILTIAAHKPTLIMFYASWCSYSKSALKVFDDLCKRRSSATCNIPEDYMIGIYDATDASDKAFAETVGGAFRKYPHLVFWPRGISHASERCNLMKESLPNHVESRTVEKLCEKFQVKSFTDVVEKIGGGQCNVIISRYEAWTHRIFNGKKVDVPRVPLLRFLTPDGKVESYDGDCNQSTSLEAWIKARLPQPNAELDDIRARFTEATTEAEKQALLRQGFQTALKVSIMGESVEDYFSFFKQALESLSAKPLEASKEEL
ncbi:hypothetical protein EC968_001267 [Mortierella alpina]|nr:hypothetical protein EC968_001267 [Mortierella alpina]